MKETSEKNETLKGWEASLNRMIREDFCKEMSLKPRTKLKAKIKDNSLSGEGTVEYVKGTERSVQLGHSKRGGSDVSMGERQKPAHARPETMVEERGFLF